MDAKKQMSLYVAFLRALYQIYQNAHWETKGEVFYGNHLLFQRLYEATQEHVDNAAEKTIGVYGTLYKLDPLIARLCMKYSAKNFNDNWAKTILTAENIFLKFSQKLYDDLKDNNEITLGVDDLIMAISNAHEVHVYLLKQILK